MRLEIREHTDDKYVEAVCRGFVDRKGLMEAIADLRRVEGYVDGLNALWDFREADLSGFAADDMKAVLAYMEQTPRRKDVQIAILVAGAADLLLLKLWQVVSNRRYGQTTKLFTDREDAHRWLSGPG
ncbi:hypothetical protein [Nisaea sediminum]|uniref:hypothetical protein n=1 Tax=Nisaea sediminum TaxID=2775867 RepID=UPI001867D480|nr:hypothetical protein [Nisaea sediminum]